MRTPETVGRSVLVILSLAATEAACASQPAIVASTPKATVAAIPTPDYGLKSVSPVVAGVASTPEATTQPSATATVKPIDTATATPKPTIEPTKEATAVPEVPLKRYDVWSGYLTKPGGTTRAGVIVISYLPDLPGQVNSIFITTIVERTRFINLFDPQNIQGKKFEARDWATMGGVRTEKLGSMKLGATLDSPTTLSGSIVIPRTPQLEFSIARRGSGQNDLLDEAVRLYNLQLGYGPGATMNRSTMLNDIAKYNIRLP